MTRFHLMADAIFEAEDLDDALSLLVHHFAALLHDRESPLQFLPPSAIDLERVL